MSSLTVLPWETRVAAATDAARRDPLLTGSRVPVVSAMAFDPPGSLLAVGHSRGECHIYDFDELVTRWHVAKHDYDQLLAENDAAFEWDAALHASPWASPSLDDLVEPVRPPAPAPAPAPEPTLPRVPMPAEAVVPARVGVPRYRQTSLRLTRIDVDDEEADMTGDDDDSASSASGADHVTDAFTDVHDGLASSRPSSKRYRPLPMSRVPLPAAPRAVPPPLAPPPPPPPVVSRARRSTVRERVPDGSRTFDMGVPVLALLPYVSHFHSHLSLYRIVSPCILVVG